MSQKTCCFPLSTDISRQYFLYIDPTVNNEHPNNFDDIPIRTDNEEIEETNKFPNLSEDENEHKRQTIIPDIQNDSVINHNHTEEEEG